MSARQVNVVLRFTTADAAMQWFEEARASGLLPPVAGLRGANAGELEHVTVKDRALIATAVEDGHAWAVAPKRQQPGVVLE